jgi:hypothetical protein
MAQGKNASPHEPIVAGPGAPPISAVGTSLVVHEWTESGPPWAALPPLGRRSLARAGGIAAVPVRGPRGRRPGRHHGLRARRRAPHLPGDRRALPLSDLPDAQARSPDRPAARPVRPLRTARHARRIRHRAGGIGCAAGAPPSAVACLSGQTRRAGLDVFDQGPPPDDHPPFALPNAILSPHSAGLSKEAAIRMPLSTARNALAGIDGKLDRTMVVNREVL